MNSIGERLKKLRLSVKKTLDEQSQVFNVALNTVYRWEHNLCIPRKSVLRKIAAYYNVPFEWILNGSASGNRYDDISANGSENAEEESSKCDDCILNPEKNTDQIILRMLRKLPDKKKYKIIGYIERMCLEGDE